MYFSDPKNVNDDYLSQCFYWAGRFGQKLPVYQIHSTDTTHSIESEKYVLMVTGNENHFSLDHFYEDDRIVAVIKNYPHMKNMAPNPNAGQAYETVLVNNTPKFKTEKEDVRTLNIPLGFTNNFRVYASQKKQFEVGFIGQWTQIRENFIDSFEKHLEETNEDPNRYQFGFYEGFGGFHQKVAGCLETEEYSFQLSNFKMAFCFGGQSPETFRHVEAAYAGCGLFSTPLPDTWYYKKIPAIISVPGACFGPTFTQIKDNNHIQEYQAAASRWYNQYASPPVVGKKIAQHVKELQIK